MWPFGKRPVEDRGQGGSFSDAVFRLIESNAETATTIGQTAAIEACTGLLQRSLAGCRVEGPEWAVPAIQRWLPQAGRDLVRLGETCALIRMAGSGFRLLPAGQWDWYGGTADPESWRVRVTLYGPQSSETVTTGRESVVWIPWATDPVATYSGRSAARFAQTSSQLDARVEASLAQESGGPVAQIIPVPSDGGDDSLASLRTGIGQAQGKAILLETTAAGFGEGVSAAPRKDWIASRLGPNPPAPLVELARDAFDRVLASHGVPCSLFTDADGTSQRESMRRYALTVLHPVGRCIERELRDRVDVSIRLSFDNYWVDLAGRASAYSNLTDGKLDADTARRIVGL